MARTIKAVRVDSGAQAPPPPTPRPLTHTQTHARAHTRYSRLGAHILLPWISLLFRVIPALKGNDFLSKIIWSAAHACVVN